MSLDCLSQTALFGILAAVEGDSTPLPLKRTSVSAQVVGPLAMVAVTQHFSNPLKEAVELAYLFPLPHKAAIVDFELRVGQRVIKSDLQEIEQAQKAYKEAVEEGKKAGLLEERRPNLFSIQIAHINPGEDILAVIRYSERLGYQDGSYEFIFPMGITPKYNSPEHPEEGKGVDAPLAAAGEPIGPVELNLAVDAGTAAGDPSSPSHAIVVTRLDERRFVVQLAGENIPDHDFVLHYPVAARDMGLGAWRVSDGEADFFLVTLLPPALDESDLQAQPREFIFVLDRSGSMRGEPIAQARNALRACLRALNEEDTFRILLFDDLLDWYDKEPARVTQENVDRADEFLAGVEGRGGTEIVAALEESLCLPEDPQRIRFIIFLTDGAVAAEARALEEIRKKLGQARLFTFGIGPSVNRAFLNQIARQGRGMAEFLQLNEDIEGAIIRFQDRVGFPVLTNIQLRWDDGKAWDVYPSLLPDLYSGQPLEICGRLAKSEKPARLVVSGKQGGQPVELLTELPCATIADPAIGRAWARARLDDLLDREAAGLKEAHKVRSEIISLAMEYRLVTPYTAFIAVDSEITVKEGKAKKISIAQPLPQGLDINGFLGLPVQMPLAAGMRSMGAVPAAPARINATLGLGFADAFETIMPTSIMTRSMAEKVAPTGNQVQIGLPPQEALRWLARAQKLNGSWNEDVEMTAAALLVFVRNGHTSRLGNFRKQVQRAADWLLKTKAAGFAALARCAALDALAKATQTPAHLQAAAEALSRLPEPKSDLQKTALAFIEGKPAQPPAEIKTLDDLRLAGLLGFKLEVPGNNVFMASDSDLVNAWAAAMGQ